MNARIVLPIAGLVLSILCGASLAAAQARPSRVRVTEKFMQTQLIKKVEPKWPTDGVHIRGVVVLQALIDKEGNVENLKAISGHPMLVPAALDAVKQWRYKPYKLNGAVWPVETTIHVNFFPDPEHTKPSK